MKRSDAIAQAVAFPHYTTIMLLPKEVKNQGEGQQGWEERIPYVHGELQVISSTPPK